MVDGGGGNTVLRQLKYAGLAWKDMKEIFVTHKHLDHLMGIVWMLRSICQAMAHGEYEGQVNIYSHREVIALLKDMAERLLLKKQARFIGTRVHLITVEDGQEWEIHGRKVTFFDIRSTKDRQFGFCMELEGGERLTCCGDEPYKPCEEKYAKGCKWLLHEAFCLHSQVALFSPYEMHHSTVMDACRVAQELGVENLLLYHTEDQNIENRKDLYTREGCAYFHGNLYIPDDLETIVL